MNTDDAAEYLGIARKTLYKWKQQARANGGFLILQGTSVPFTYRQTGVLGQGRIQFEKSVLDELRNAMVGRFSHKPAQRKKRQLQNITSSLGLPPE